MKAKTTDQQIEGMTNWIMRPTKISLIIILTLWLIGNGLLILVGTDFFQRVFGVKGIL